MKDVLQPDLFAFALSISFFLLDFSLSPFKSLLHFPPHRSSLPGYRGQARFSMFPSSSFHPSFVFPWSAFFSSFHLFSLVELRREGVFFVAGRYLPVFQYLPSETRQVFLSFAIGFRILPLGFGRMSPRLWVFLGGWYLVVPRIPYLARIYRRPMAVSLLVSFWRCTFFFFGLGVVKVDFIHAVVLR